MMQPAEGAAVSESAKGLIFRLEREINFRFLLKNERIYLEFIFFLGFFYKCIKIKNINN